MEIGIDKLKIREGGAPLPSIEIDVDSTEDGNHREIIEKALAEYAASHPDLVASVYDYVGPSVNFGRMTQSVFFAVNRNQALMKFLLGKLKGIASLSVRQSDYISPGEMQLTYHVQDGKAWRLVDRATFSSIDEEQA